LTALLLVALVLLVLANGFFVAAEFALVRSRRARIEELAADGDAAYRRVLKQLDRISEYLSACQFGITLASLGIGFLGEPAIAELIEPAFGGLSHGVAVALAVAIAYAISTALHITVGEQVPKIYAIVKAERVARRVARPLDWFNVSMRLPIILLNRASNSLLRVVRIDPDAQFAEGQSPEELRFLIAQAQTGGLLDPGEAGMLQGVFHLHEQEARQVMTPIPAVVTVDVSENVQQALRQCVNSGHTRLLVTQDDNPDHVRGIAHANALARALMNQGPDAPLEFVVREAPIVPETKPLDDLLADMRRQRASLAVVADEYGRTTGIVTVEDIIEEIVGEIVDETDPVLSPIRRLQNGDWFVRGHVSLGDLADNGVQLPVDSEAYNSVGGYVFDELGRLPKRGDVVDANGHRIRVESVRENRIEAVRISPQSGAART
jgi:CBS domain containing-hemolysin-like protein